MSSEEKISNADSTWYLAEILQQCRPVDDYDETDKHTVWGSYHLIKADSPEAAYDKAEKLGKDKESVHTSHGGKKMKWNYVGLANLLPIYEDIEDLSEIMWTDRGLLTKKGANEFVYTKEAFLKEVRPKPKDTI